MRKETTYYQTKGGELVTSTAFIDDAGRTVATSAGEKPRGAKAISKVQFEDAVRRQVAANETAQEEAQERLAAEQAKLDAESAEKAAALRSWLKKMDAPPEVLEALTG